MLHGLLHVILIVVAVDAQSSWFDIFGRKPSAPTTTNKDDFQVTTVGRRRETDSQDSRGGFVIIDDNRGSRDTRPSFPDNFRIEIDLVRMENPDGVLANGQPCDHQLGGNNHHCDPRVSVYIDVKNPNAPWPGTFPSNRWAIEHEATNNNSPRIGKVITRDVCGEAINNVNVRIWVTDLDDLSAHDEIGRFECVFPLPTRDIAPAASSAIWGRVQECSHLNSRMGKVRFFIRTRAFAIPSTSCRTKP